MHQHARIRGDREAHLLHRADAKEVKHGLPERQRYVHHFVIRLELLPEDLGLVVVSLFLAAPFTLRKHGDQGPVLEGRMLLFPGLTEKSFNADIAAGRGNGINVVPREKVDLLDVLLDLARFRINLGINEDIGERGRRNGKIGGPVELAENLPDLAVDRRRILR